MNWRRVYWMGVKMVSWYQFYRYGFFLDYRELSVEGRCIRVLVRFTCHIPEDPVWWPSIMVWTWLSTVRRVALKVDVQPSLHSWPMEMIPPEQIWLKMWYILSLVFISGIRYGYYRCVTCIRLPSRSMTWGPFYTAVLLINGMITLI